MLHLVFCNNGLERIHELLRPTDQVVQFYGDHILLVDVDKYLKSLQQSQSGTVEGQIIDQYRLVNLIENAPSIKSTY